MINKYEKFIYERLGQNEGDINIVGIHVNDKNLDVILEEISNYFNLKSFLNADFVRKSASRELFYVNIYPVNSNYNYFWNSINEYDNIFNDLDEPNTYKLEDWFEKYLNVTLEEFVEAKKLGLL